MKFQNGRISKRNCSKRVQNGGSKRPALHTPYSRKDFVSLLYSFLLAKEYIRIYFIYSKGNKIKFESPTYFDVKHDEPKYFFNLVPQVNAIKNIFCRSPKVQDLLTQITTRAKMHLSLVPPKSTPKMTPQKDP